MKNNFKKILNKICAVERYREDESELVSAPQELPANIPPYISNMELVPKRLRDKLSPNCSRAIRMLEIPDMRGNNTGEGAVFPERFTGEKYKDIELNIFDFYQAFNAGGVQNQISAALCSELSITSDPNINDLFVEGWLNKTLRGPNGEIIPDDDAIYDDFIWDLLGRLPENEEEFNLCVEAFYYLLQKIRHIIQLYIAENNLNAPVPPELEEKVHEHPFTASNNDAFVSILKRIISCARKKLNNRVFISEDMV